MTSPKLKPLMDEVEIVFGGTVHGLSVTCVVIESGAVNLAGLERWARRSVDAGYDIAVAVYSPPDADNRRMAVSVNNYAAARGAGQRALERYAATRCTNRRGKNEILQGVEDAVVALTPPEKFDTHVEAYSKFLDAVKAAARAADGLAEHFVSDVLDRADDHARTFRALESRARASK